MSLERVIYVMGPPGAGKGTQAQLLAEEIGYVRFSTGDAFRAVANQDSELGRQVRETIDNGYLAPPSMAAEIVIDQVKKHLEAGEGLLFDGSPRTVEEAAIIDDFFAQGGYGRPLVIYLKVDREEMIRRNSQRKFCLDVKGDFPVVTEEDEKRCLDKGGRVGVRPDDEPEKFATRWSEFMNRTYPVIAKYTGQGIVEEIDGMKSIREVHSDVMKAIHSRQS